MTDRSAPLFTPARLAAAIAAAGFLFVSGAAAQTTLPPPAFGTADQRQDRIEALEGQLREATAENERLQFELREAQREIQRLRSMVGELAGVNQSLATPPAEGEAPAGGEAQQPNQNGPANLTPAQRAHTGTLGTMPADAAPPSAPSDPGAAYTRARTLLNNGNYAEAEIAFAEFLRDHADADTAPDARYWYGLVLLERDNDTDAAASFVDYLRRYPSGPRAPDAQVLLGRALLGMGQTRQACAAWADVARRYPRATRAREAASREALSARCG